MPSTSRVRGGFGTGPLGLLAPLGPLAPPRSLGSCGCCSDPLDLRPSLCGFRSSIAAQRSAARQTLGSAAMPIDGGLWRGGAGAPGAADWAHRLKGGVAVADAPERRRERERYRDRLSELAVALRSCTRR